MFFIQARSTISSLSVGTDCPSTAIGKIEELAERGLRQVIVTDVRGQEISREELERLAGEAEAA